MKLYKAFIKQVPGPDAKINLNMTESKNESELRNVVKEMLLLEIGQKQTPYKSSLKRTTRQSVMYEFYTENGTRYEVMLSRFRNSIEVEFEAYLRGEASAASMTGEGKALRVVQTIISIVKKFFKNNPSEWASRIDKIEFVGMPKDPRGHKGATIRSKLYLKFARAQFPGALVKNPTPNTITISNFKQYI